MEKDIYENDCSFRWPNIPIAAFDKKNVANFSETFKFRDLDNDEILMNKTVSEFMHKNRARERYSRLHDADLRCQKDRLVFLCPPSSKIGYLTSSNKRFIDFIFDLRNTLRKEVDDADSSIVDTLLINYCARQPYSVEISKNPDYLVNKEHYPVELLEKVSNLYKMAFTKSMNQVTIDDLHIQDKKRTSMGFPYEDVDGKPVKRDDILFGLKKDFENRKTRYYLNWFQPKNTWRCDKGGKSILLKQLAMVGSNFEINPGNVGACIEDGLISVHNGALRENCPDAPLDVPKVATPKGLYTSKNRRFTFFTENQQYDGTLSNKVINDIIHRVGEPALDWGVANRERKIYPSNNVMHSNGTIYATAALHNVERNCKGNPSTNENVLNDWNGAATYYGNKGLHCDLVTGDCTNAEVTVCTNFDLLIHLIPDNIRGYLTLCANSVIPCGRTFRFVRGSYCSAVWYTTYFHICKGNFENARVAAKVLKDNGYNVKSTEEIILGCLTVLLFAGHDDILCKKMLGDDYDIESRCFHAGDGCWLNPKLATDDMAMQYFTPRGVILSDSTVKYFEGDQLGIEIGETVQFGMRENGTLLKENVGSRIAKLATSEHMGFSYKDGMSFYLKATNCGYTEIVDSVLKKHFGYGVDDYQPYVTLYAKWLTEMGLDPVDDFNEWSPSEQLLVGRLIDRYGETFGSVKGDEGVYDLVDRSDKYMTSSARVNNEYVASILDIFKQL